MRPPILLIFLIFLLSCKQAEDYSGLNKEFETIHVNLDEAGSLYMSEYFSDIEYIHLQSPDDRPIGRIRKFLIQDSFLGFYDAARNSMWIYTPEGEFLNEVVIPRGRGPGELENIEDIILTQDGEVHALGTFKIVAYDIEGAFMGETSFNFWIYKFTYDAASQEYIGYPSNALNRGLNNEHTGQTILYLNKDGEITDSDFPIPNGREELGYSVPNKFPDFQKDLLFFTHLVDTVYSLKEFGPVPKYALDYGKHSIPEEVFERRKNYESTHSSDPDGRFQFVEHELQENGYISYLTFFNETTNYIHFRISTGNDPYAVLYNKKTKKTDVGARSFVNDIDYGYVPFMYDSSDDALYTIIEANDLLHHLNEIYENEPEKYSTPQMQHLVRLGQQLSDNSNPILQILTFKTREEK